MEKDKDFNQFKALFESANKVEEEVPSFELTWTRAALQKEKQSKNRRTLFFTAIAASFLLLIGAKTLFFSTTTQVHSDVFAGLEEMTYWTAPTDFLLEPNFSDGLSTYSDESIDWLEEPEEDLIPIEKD